MKVLIGWVLLSFFLFGFTNTQNTIVLDSKSELVVPEYFGIYKNPKDINVHLILSDSILNQFKFFHKSDSNYGYTNDIFWIYFTIKNISDVHEWYLSVGNPQLSKITCYLVNDTIIESVGYRGQYFVGKHKSNKFNFPLFKIHVSDSSKRAVLLKIESSTAIIIPLKIQTAENLLQSEKYNHIFTFILFGLLLTLILYNFIFSIINKEVNNLFLALNLLFIFLYFFFAFGYGYIIFSNIPSSLRVNIRLIFYSFEIVFALLFTQYFLDLKKYKLINRIYQLLLVIYCLFIFRLFFDLTPTSTFIKTLVFSHCSILLVTISVSVYCYIKGYKPALYYIVSLITVIIGSSSYLLTIAGFNNSNSNFELANIISASLFGLFLTIGLNNKLEIVNREEEKTKQLEADNLILLKEIAERKKAEQKIRLLSKAIDQSANTVVITDVNGVIEYINPKFTELTGYTPEEALGAKPSILNSGLLPESFFTSLWDTINRGEIWNGVFNNKKKNGQLYWESATISPIYDENSKIVQFLAIKEDITLQKANEDALKDSEEQLRELNATKDKFFSIIAHDLGNSFNALTGFSQILLEDFGIMSQEQKIEIITNIYNSSKKTYQLFQNLLIWSRSQTGRIPFIPVPLSIKKVIAENIEMLLVSSEGKQISLNSQITDDIYIMADENMLNTIFRNLISNAIKFTRAGGLVSLSAIKRKDELELHVTDNGIGMQPENIKKLFRIDVNVTTLGTENELGTGLGLILCKEFVEKHGGRIWVTSTYGQGSDFIFTLPLHN